MKKIGLLATTILVGAQLQAAGAAAGGQENRITAIARAVSALPPAEQGAAMARMMSELTPAEMMASCQRTVSAGLASERGAALPAMYADISAMSGVLQSGTMSMEDFLAGGFASTERSVAGMLNAPEPHGSTVVEHIVTMPWNLLPGMAALGESFRATLPADFAETLRAMPIPEELSHGEGFNQAAENERFCAQYRRESKENFTKAQNALLAGQFEEARTLAATSLEKAEKALPLARSDREVEGATRLAREATELVEMANGILNG